jgi:2'-5' RNA ligase
MRLFYAIGLWELLDTAPLRRGFEGIRELRWVDPDLIHITLNFLGEVDRETCDEAVSRLAHVAPSHMAFALEFGSTGAFPERGNPRVLWVGLSRRSAERVSRLSRDLGNDRPSPHVTIARVKGTVQNDVVERWSRVEPNWPDLHVEQIQLVESKLTPRGPIYSIVASESLGC